MCEACSCDEGERREGEKGGNRTTESLNHWSGEWRIFPSRFYSVQGSIPRCWDSCVRFASRVLPRRGVPLTNFRHRFTFHALFDIREVFNAAKTHCFFLFLLRFTLMKTFFWYYDQVALGFSFDFNANRRTSMLGLSILSLHSLDFAFIHCSCSKEAFCHVTTLSRAQIILHLIDIFNHLLQVMQTTIKP